MKIVWEELNTRTSGGSAFIWLGFPGRFIRLQCSYDIGHTVSGVSQQSVVIRRMTLELLACVICVRIIGKEYVIEEGEGTLARLSQYKYRHDIRSGGSLHHP